MVVDDEVDILLIIRKFLERWGYEVDTFSDPLRAYEHFRKGSEGYALALLDIRMPELSGIALAVMLLKIRADIKIAIMSAYEITPREFAMSLPNLRHEDIVKKPFRLEQICNAVKKKLQETSPTG